MPYDIASGQAAKLLGIHQSTATRWAEEGKIPGLKTPGGHWRFRQEDIDAFIADHKATA